MSASHLIRAWASADLPCFARDGSVPRGFATLVITLPSNFIGGTFEVREGGSATLVHSEHQSSSTLAIGWLHGLEVSSSPITQGSRACLVYDLFYPQGTLLPTLTSVHPGVKELKNILSAWNDLGYKGPQKLVCLLDDTYGCLRISALRGQDRQLAEALLLVAADCGFKVGLGSIAAESPGRGGDCNRSGSNLAKFLADETGAKIIIKELFKMDGRLMIGDVNFDPEREAVPRNLVDSIFEGAPGDGESDDMGIERSGPNGKLEKDCIPVRPAYTGPRPPRADPFSLSRHAVNAHCVHCSPMIPRTQTDLVYSGCHRSAVVIWPAYRDDEVMGRATFTEAVCKRLQDPSRMPHEEQHQLTDLLLFHVTSGQEKKPSSVTLVLRTVCKVACQLRDETLWDRAMASCSGYLGVLQLGVAGLVSALRRLPTEAVLPR